MDEQTFQLRVMETLNDMRQELIELRIEVIGLRNLLRYQFPQPSTDCVLYIKPNPQSTGYPLPGPLEVIS